MCYLSCVSIHVGVCVRARVHACVCVCMRACVHACVCVTCPCGCAHACVRVRVCVDTHMHANVCRVLVPWVEGVCMSMHGMCMCVYVCVCVCLKPSPYVATYLLECPAPPGNILVIATYELL